MTNINHWLNACALDSARPGSESQRLFRHCGLQQVTSPSLSFLLRKIIMSSASLHLWRMMPCQQAVPGT